MRNTYIQQLPKDYFDGLYNKVVTSIQNNQNTCISAMVGCGGKTFLNLFLHHYQNDSSTD